MKIIHRNYNKQLSKVKIKLNSSYIKKIQYSLKNKIKLVIE